MTEAEKEVMAGETVPTVLKAFKAKLEAMSDDEFVVENIFQMCIRDSLLAFILLFYVANSIADKLIKR